MRRIFQVVLSSTFLLATPALSKGFYANGTFSGELPGSHELYSVELATFETPDTVTLLVGCSFCPKTADVSIATPNWPEASRVFSNVVLVEDRFFSVSGRSTSGATYGFLGSDRRITGKFSLDEMLGGGGAGNQTKLNLTLPDGRSIVLFQVDK